MKRIYLLPAIALIGALAPPAETSGQAARVDSLVASVMRERRIPGAAIAVIENGKVVFRKAYGIANLEQGTPLTVDHVFELASVTKQFTAAAIMMLVREGKVGLDSLISRYIPETPPGWARITVRHLLTHTSGLNTASVPRIGDSAPLRISTKTALDFTAQQPMRFQPGQDAWYSDAGYFLLGMIIEKASGQSYRQFLQQRIFDPLHMSATSILDKERVLKGRVSTYTVARDGVWLNWRRDWDHELPAFFGIFSTLDDLVKWDAALRTGSLLDSAALRQIWTPAKLDNGQYARVFDQYYGFGWDLNDLRGERTVGHGGASGTYILRVLEKPITVIVLTNRDVMGSRHPVLLARSIAGLLHPEYRPVELLPPQTDPNPQSTERVKTILADIAAGRESTEMSADYLAWWKTAVGYRAFIPGQIREIAPLVYLGSADTRGKTFWNGMRLERLAYYKTMTGERLIYLTVGFSPDGKIGRLDLQLYQ
jgi:D-alanyl-D-alanine carboxypeptidase